MSAISLLEVLVVAYRAGDVQLARRYEWLLTRSRGLRLVDITREQLQGAAQLRAVTGMKTPDAFQMAAALSTDCRTFLTNNRKLPTVGRLRILQLSSYNKLS